MKEGVSLLGAKKERNFELCTQLKSNNNPNVDSYIQTEGRPFYHTGHDTLDYAWQQSAFLFSVSKVIEEVFAGSVYPIKGLRSRNFALKSYVLSQAHSLPISAENGTFLGCKNARIFNEKSPFFRFSNCLLHM